MDLIKKFVTVTTSTPQSFSWPEPSSSSLTGRDEKEVAEAIGADSCIYNEITCLEAAVRDCVPEELRSAQPTVTLVHI